MSAPCVIAPAVATLAATTVAAMELGTAEVMALGPGRSEGTVGMAGPLAVYTLVVLLVTVPALTVGATKVMALRLGRSEEMAGMAGPASGVALTVTTLTALLVDATALALGTTKVTVALRPGRSEEKAETVESSLGTELGHSDMEIEIAARVVRVTGFGMQPLAGVLRCIRSEGRRIRVQILEKVGRQVEHWRALGGDG